MLLVKGEVGRGIRTIGLEVNGRMRTHVYSGLDGKFEIPNADRMIGSVSDTVKVIAVDRNYVEHARQTMSIQPGEITYSLTQSDYRIGDSRIQGQVSRSLAKVGLEVNGKTVRMTDSGVRDYSFLNLQNLINTGNDSVEVYGVDWFGVERVRNKVKIIDERLLADPYTFEDTRLTGVYGTNISAVHLLIEDKVVAEAEMSDGKYSFSNVNQFVSSPEMEIKIVGLDEKGEKKQEISPSIQKGQFDYRLSTVNKDYFKGDPFIKGSKGKDITKVRLVINGQVASEIESTEEVFQFDVKNLIQSTTDQVQIIGLNKANLVRAMTDIQIIDQTEGTFGEVHWKWDNETKTLQFEGGNFPSASIRDHAYLKRLSIQAIRFTKETMFPVNSYRLFGGLADLERIEGLENIDTSNVRIFDYMFIETPKLKSVKGIEQWDTSNAESFTGIFCNSGIEELNLSSWKTSKLESMVEMFASSKVRHLDLGGWDTSKVGSMFAAFRDANQLETLNLANWDTSLVFPGETFSMFDNTDKLDSLTLGPKFRFSGGIIARLPEKQDDVYTGRWIYHEDENVIFNSSANLMKNYDGLKPGTYQRERVNK